jgi:aminoglycoside 3-N-acetyltransferase
VGGAACRAVPLRPLVDFATGWLPAHRDLRRGVAPPGWRAVREAGGPLPVPAPAPSVSPAASAAVVA